MRAHESTERSLGSLAGHDPDDPCFICGSTQASYLYPARDLLHDIEGDFALYACKGCGVVSTHPKLSLTEIEKYYPEDYIAFPGSVTEEKHWLKRKDRLRGVRRRCDFTIKHAGVKRGSLLDIGSATGVFLDGMRQRGWQVWGVEPSDYAANYSQTNLGLDVAHGYLTEGLFPPSYFDVITLWDVFEHLPDPAESLKIIRQILKPGGLLLITTPNSGSWGRLIYQSAWAGWDVPRHYYIYNKTSLQRLVEAHGFTFESIRSFTGRQGAAAISIDFYLKAHGCSDRLRKSILNFYNSFPVRLLTYPYFQAIDFLNRSAIMTMLFRRDQG